MCGIFGVYTPEDDQTAAGLTRLGLVALQHRGEQSCGVVVTDGGGVKGFKGQGLVSQVLSDDRLDRLTGSIALGHISSSPDTVSSMANVLPLYSSSRHGVIGVAHDGNLIDGDQLRQRLLSQGALLQTESDSEIIAHLLAGEEDSCLVQAVRHIVPGLRGAFAVGVLNGQSLIGFRDPLGIRPLSVGRAGDDWFLSSESCAFDAVGATLVRDVAPGEICVIDKDGFRSFSYATETKTAYCVFEFIYFARADSVMNGKSVHEVRKEFGRRLAEEASIPADLVVPAPDSALSAAIGYAERSGIPFDIALAKNRYVGRTFSYASQKTRAQGINLKLNPIQATVKGRRIILVDDSIVRGTTSGRTIRMLRDAGAREVHMVVASPPFSHPCQYGIHIPTPEELIAARRSNEEICALIGADSLTYLSVASLYGALGMEETDLCTACFGGGQPPPV